jgi:hypothetical protein
LGNGEERERKGKGREGKEKKKEAKGRKGGRKKEEAGRRESGEVLCVTATRVVCFVPAWECTAVTLFLF